MKITYEDKVSIQNDEEVAKINKVTDDDMNEIKKVVNTNYDELETAKTSISSIETEQKTQNTNISNLQADNKINKTDISNIKAEQTEQNTELEELRAENQRLREDLNGLPSGTAEGETIDLTDSAEMRLSKLNISGNSKQETRSGKNKFIPLPTESNSGVAITLNMDGTYNLEGTAVNNSENINYIDIEKSGIKEGLTYILSATKDLPEGVLVRAEIYNGTTWVRQFVPSISSTNKTSTGIANFTNATRIRFLVLINSGITVNIKNIGFQLEEGTIATDYEQYGASPSPEYSSEVESCGDNINLNDGINQNYYINTMTTTCGVASGNSGKIIETNGSEYITISSKVNQERFRAGCINQSITGDTSRTLYNGVNKDNGNIITVNCKEYKYVVVNATDLLYLKIEKGSIASPYSPYGQGCINEVICNKNILPYVEKVNYNMVTGVDYYGITYMQKVKSNTSYILSTIDKLKSGFQLREYDKEGNVIQTTSKTLGTTFTTNSKTQYIKFRTNDLVSKITNPNFMLEESKTLSDYIEHKSQTYTIPTQQPFRSNGDIRDTFIKKNNKWYERHYIQRVIFDGTEVWVIQGTNLYNVENILPNHIATNYIKAIQSNYYLGVQTRPTNADFLNFVSNYDFACCLHPNGTTMRFKDTRNLDLATFKSWLSELYNAGTPVYVDYILETPLDIECTEEQSKILWDIEQNAKTYDKVTHIYSTDKISPVIEVTYKKDIETLFANALVESGV